MKFKSIKIRDGKVTLAWESHPEGDEATVFTGRLISKDEPEKEFFDALEALGPHVLWICGLPKEYGAGMEVTGVSIQRGSEDRMSAVITAKKTVENANSPFNISTPKLYEPDMDEEGAHLPKGAVETIDRLQEMAERFVKGHRSQGDLFEREDAEEPKPELVTS